MKFLIVASIVLAALCAMSNIGQTLAAANYAGFSGGYPHGLQYGGSGLPGFSGVGAGLAPGNAAGYSGGYPHGLQYGGSGLPGFSGVGAGLPLGNAATYQNAGDTNSIEGIKNEIVKLINLGLNVQAPIDIL